MKNLKYQQRSHHRDQYNNSINDGDPSPVCEEKQLYSSSNANGFTDHGIDDDDRNPILEPRATDDSCEREKIYQRQKGGLMRTHGIARKIASYLLFIAIAICYIYRQPQFDDTPIKL